MISGAFLLVVVVVQRVVSGGSPPAPAARAQTARVIAVGVARMWPRPLGGDARGDHHVVAVDWCGRGRPRPRPRRPPFPPTHPDRPGSSTTCWATSTSPPTRTRACTPLRAVENFPITGMPISRPTRLDRRAGRGQAGRRRWPTGTSALLDAARPTRSSPPARRSAHGALHDQFVVDVIQGGAGTSTNMNANEVIANRGAGAAGPPRGRLRSTCTRNEHVNLGQSTNDVYPTAVKLALTCAVRAAARGDGRAARRLRAQRPSSSPTCSRWAAPSCRTRCR